MNITAERLIELRSKKGVTQETAADACNISRVTLARYENGTRKKIAPENLAALAQYYGVSVDFLLGRDDSIFITGNPGSGKSSILTGDWYPSAPPQSPLVLDGGPPRGIIEDRPETQAIAAEVLCEALNHGVTKEEALAFIKNYAQLMPQERKTIMSNMMFLRSQHNEEGET